METITVDKAALLDTLRTNRSNHKAEYDKAVAAYTKRFVEEAKRFADEAVRRASNKMGFAQFQWLPVPEEHTDDFDRAIQMLEWSVSETVELSEYDFQSYVQNNWRWASSFASNTSSYTVGSR
jgi:hypothetical protein